MSSTKVIDTGKISTWLLGIALSFFAWFGKVTYDKLISMDEKLEMLLVQNGINNTKIENIENQIKTMEPCSNKGNKTGHVNMKYDAILPTQEDDKRKYSLAAK
jgi:hypothetical protein